MAAITRGSVITASTRNAAPHREHRLIARMVFDYLYLAPVVKQ